MRLDLADTLVLLDRLLEKEPQTSKPGGFTVRLRRLRELLAEMNTAEPTLAAVAGFVFPGVSPNSLRTTLLEFRKSLVEAASSAGLQIELIRPDARGIDAGEVICHFEGVPLPFVFDTSVEETALSRENEVIEPRARATKIFVSFAMKDLSLSQEFTDFMKTNLPLRCAEPVQLWRFDGKDGILPGENNEAIIRQQMEESRFGILLVSPDYLASQFIQRVELPHFIGKNARAHPIPVALSDFKPGQDKHELLNPTNVFSYKGKDFAHTPKKDRPDFVKALCDRIAVLISTRTSLEKPSAKDFAQLCPELRKEDGHYIPNRGRTERSLGKSAGKPDDDTNEASVPVLETLQAWMDDPVDSAYMAVLGEAGAGKTMTCSKLAHSLNAKHPGRCIYIDLRHLNESGLLKTQPNPTLEEILTAILGRSTSHEKVTPERVLQAVREQGALLIWDGLDEVLAHLSAEEGDAFFKQLKEALPPRLIRNSGKTPGRLLIACRTHYFRSFEHEASTLTQAQRGPVHANAPEDQRARFRVLRLLPFDDDQIRAYLAANVPGLDLERAVDVIHRVHNLRDLAQRPYCLSLMRNSLPDLDRTLAAGKKVRSVDLYRSLVRSWLARDNTKHRFDEDDKPRLMASLAAWMWREGAKSLTSERLGQWLKETIIADPTFHALYGDSFKETKMRDELLQDFRTATFIARWDGDSFRFAHTSLQEYFLASALVAALENGDADAWLMPRVNQETLDFAAELFLQRAEESPAARTRLEHTLAKLLEESVPGRSKNTLAFYQRLHATGESSWIPPKMDLRNLDLTAWEFAGTTQNPLRLPQVDFSGALLIRTRFHHVELAGSRWQGADLCSAEFLDCALESADFTSVGNGETSLEGVRLRECRLSDSKITGATLDGFQIELPRWDVPTEEHWHATLRDYQAAPKASTYGQWAAPLPTGSTSPLPLGASLPSPPSAQWSSGHRGVVVCVAYFPDGRRIVSGSGDRSIRIWDVDSGQCLHILEGHTEGVWQLAVSQDGRFIASAAHDGLVRVWDGENGTFLRTLHGQSGYAMSVAFSSDGSHIVGGTSNYCVGIWETESGECLQALEAKRQGSSFFGEALALANDGKIASSVDIKSIIVWGENFVELLLKGHTGQICCMDFSPDSRQLVSGAYENAARVWDLESGNCLFVLEGHSKHVRSVCYSPDGCHILSGSEDNSLRLWDAKTGICLHVFQGLSDSVSSAAFSPDGSRIVVGSGMSVQVWDFESRILVREIKGRHNWISCTAFSNGGSKIAMGCYFDWISIWDISTGMRRQRFEGHGKSVSIVVFSPDDSRIVSGSGTGMIRVCDVATGNTLLSIEAHASYVIALAFSPDGNRLASASNDKTVTIWEAETGVFILALEGNSEMITNLIFSADGRWILGCQKNGQDPRKNRCICVWDSMTGDLHRTFPGQRNCVDCVAISPDNRCIVSCSVNDPICVWAFETEECLFTIKAQTSRVTNLTFSPDGLRILTKSSDNIIRGWDSQNGTPLPVSETDELHLLKGSCQTGLRLSLSPVGTVRVKRADGTKVDIEQERSDDYAVLEKAPGESQWRIARAKGEYWRYVNYATDGSEGRVLWSADVLGPVPEV